MQPLRNQRTIAATASVEGFGFLSGRNVRVECRPAPADAGIVFVRHDLDPPVRLAARVEHRQETPRRTTLALGGARVEMVEHVMAALAGMQIDNCEVWINQPELPGLDGSALRFVEVLEAVGIVELPAPRPCLVVRKITRLGDADCWIEARPAPRGGLTLSYQLDYGYHSPIPRQSVCLETDPAMFREQMASSRTFMLQHEADTLIAQGWGSRVTPRDLLVFGPGGPIDNVLRFPDECARHKALDMLGDLALCGCDLAGHIVAHRSGHRLNAELAKALTQQGEAARSRRRSA
jgi:UDP-3-O-acyl N-acetylglucosamine deacetylase